MQVEGLSKTFHSRHKRSGRNSDVHAVRDISLTVGQAECLGIAGESGSGKSTLTRMLVGVEIPSTGSICVNGERLPEPPRAADRKRHARRIQMVFQDSYSSLDPRQPVGMVLDEVQRVHSDRHRAGRDARTAELLEAVDLGASYAACVPRALSGGQRQRLAIARALAAEPSVIVLDEAVSALDVSVQAQILNLLSDLRRELAPTYIFISHDLAVIRQVSDRVLVLYRGQLMGQGPVGQVFQKDFKVIGNLKEWAILDRLREIMMPTLFIAGRYNECMELKHDHLPGSEFALFEKSAHMSFYEEREDCMQTMNERLSRAEDSGDTQVTRL